MTRIPIYQVKLVRDGSIPFDTRRADSPERAARLLQEYLADVDREHFSVLLLDAKLHVIGLHTVAVGSLSECTVHPREVFKPAIIANASAIVLCHNHPSGDTEPSSKDISMTRRLVGAGKLLGIAVHDHTIISHNNFTSIRQTQPRIWD